MATSERIIGLSRGRLRGAPGRSPSYYPAPSSFCCTPFVSQISPSSSKDAHERRGVDAGSDRGLLSRRQAVYLRSGGKALPGKEELRIPAEGKCIKAPDWRL